MFTVYVLKSLKNGKHYTGYTNKEVAERLKEHNRGTNAWTKQNGPFELVYKENDILSKTEAIKREHFLKSGQGRLFLKDLMKD